MLNKSKLTFWFCLIWFGFMEYHLFGYLMPNPIFTNILDIWFVKTFCSYTQLNDQTVLFLRIQINENQN